MVYRKIDFKEEINDLKEYGVCAWTCTGKTQKYVTVTVDTEYGRENRKYYFSNPNECTAFIAKLRELSG